MLTMRHLEMFCAVVESRSFSRAAQRLFVTQPTVSEQVSTVERFVGVPLFIRSGRKVEVTDAGREAYQMARQVLGTLKDLQRLGQRYQTGQSGRLRVGTGSLVGSYFLPQILLDFVRIHPGVAIVHEVDSNSEDLGQKILEGQLDLGVTISTDALPPEIRAIPLWDEEAVLVARRWASPMDKGLLELTQMPFVVGTSCWPTVRRQLLQAHITPPEQVLATSSVEGAKAIIRQGDGITLLPRQACQAEIANGEFSALSLPGVRLTLQLALLLPKQDPQGTTAVFVEYLLRRSQTQRLRNSH